MENASITGLDMLNRLDRRTHAKPAIDTTDSGLANVGAKPMIRMNGIAEARVKTIVVTSPILSTIRGTINAPNDRKRDPTAKIVPIWCSSA
jgi:hypothetical protein